MSDDVPMHGLFTQSKINKALPGIRRRLLARSASIAVSYCCKKPGLIGEQLLDSSYYQKTLVHLLAEDEFISLTP